jgi:DNA-directed RNA polymerase subunit N (RpoN/RPB10)
MDKDKVTCFICGKALSFQDDIEDIRYHIYEDKFCHRLCFRKLLSSHQDFLSFLRELSEDDLFDFEIIDAEEANSLMKITFH